MLLGNGVLVNTENALSSYSGWFFNEFDTGTRIQHYSGTVLDIKSYQVADGKVIIQCSNMVALGGSASDNYAFARLNGDNELQFISYGAYDANNNGRVALDSDTYTKLGPLLLMDDNLMFYYGHNGTSFTLNLLDYSRDTITVIMSVVATTSNITPYMVKLGVDRAALFYDKAGATNRQIYGHRILINNKNTFTFGTAEALTPSTTDYYLDRTGLFMLTPPNGNMPVVGVGPYPDKGLIVASCYNATTAKTHYLLIMYFWGTGTQALTVLRNTISTGVYTYDVDDLTVISPWNINGDIEILGVVSDADFGKSGNKSMIIKVNVIPQTFSQVSAQTLNNNISFEGNYITQPSFGEFSNDFVRIGFNDDKVVKAVIGSTGIITEYSTVLDEVEINGLGHTGYNGCKVNPQRYLAINYNTTDSKIYSKSYGVDAIGFSTPASVGNPLTIASSGVSNPIKSFDIALINSNWGVVIYTKSNGTYVNYFRINNLAVLPVNNTLFGIWDQFNKPCISNTVSVAIENNDNALALTHISNGDLYLFRLGLSPTGFTKKNSLFLSTVIHPDGINNLTSIQRLTSTDFFVVYNVLQQILVRLVSTTGDTLAYTGIETLLHTGSDYNSFTTARLSATKIVVAVFDIATNSYKIYVVEKSGTTINVGTAYTIAGGDMTGETPKVVVHSSSSFSVAYTINNGTIDLLETNFNLFKGTVSGTTISSAGTTTNTSFVKEDFATVDTNRDSGNIIGITGDDIEMFSYQYTTGGLVKSPVYKILTDTTMGVNATKTTKAIPISASRTLIAYKSETEGIRLIIAKDHAL